MDIEFLLFLQGLRDSIAGVLDDMFVQFSVFGEPLYALLLMGILYWCVSKSMGVFVLMGWNISRLANGFLKITFLHVPSVDSRSSGQAVGSRDCQSDRLLVS